MSDLIDREQALSAFDTDDNKLVIRGSENADAVEQYLKKVMGKIENLPPAQPEPARWVQMLINPRMYRCSNCDVAWNKRLVFDLDHHNEMVMKYCPCCGKKILADVDYE